MKTMLLRTHYTPEEAYSMLMLLDELAILSGRITATTLSIIATTITAMKVVLVSRSKTMSSPSNARFEHLNKKYKGAKAIFYALYKYKSYPQSLR